MKAGAVVKAVLEAIRANKSATIKFDIINRTMILLVLSIKCDGVIVFYSACSNSRLLR